MCEHKVRNLKNVVAIISGAITELVSKEECDVALSLSEMLTETLRNADDGREYHNGYDVTEAVDLFTKSDKKVAGIKRFREITGAGLKEAKDFIERPKFVAVRDEKFPRQNWPPL